STYSIQHHPKPPLFPYTTLFRSKERDAQAGIYDKSHEIGGNELPRAPDVGRQHGVTTAPLHGDKSGQCGDTDRPGHQSRLMPSRSEEHTSELQSQSNLVCRLLLE